jgi:hypothetical protein
MLPSAPFDWSDANTPACIRILAVQFCCRGWWRSAANIELDDMAYRARRFSASRCAYRDLDQDFETFDLFTFSLSSR